MNSSETTVSQQEAKAIVRKFAESLTQGHMIEALELVAPDVILRDEEGSETRGIRAVAKVLLPYREPDAISVERVESSGPDVRVVFRTKRRRKVRGSFSVNRGRIRSLHLERTG